MTQLKQHKVRSRRQGEDNPFPPPATLPLALSGFCAYRSSAPDSPFYTEKQVQIRLWHGMSEAWRGTARHACLCRTARAVLPRQRQNRMGSNASFVYVSITISCLISRALKGLDDLAPLLVDRQPATPSDISHSHTSSWATNKSDVIVLVSFSGKGNTFVESQFARFVEACRSAFLKARCTE